MVYCETIEESKTWVCPKSGIWKVICVGGGSTAAVNADGSGGKKDGLNGGITSFGSKLSANGGLAATVSMASKSDISFGRFGYNGVCTYGADTKNIYGYGYGAAGGALILATYIGASACTGGNGEVKSSIMHISEGETVACTIGKGAEGDSLATKYVLCSGRDGAIIVQYLGSEM